MKTLHSMIPIRMLGKNISDFSSSGKPGNKLENINVGIITHHGLQDAK